MLYEHLILNFISILISSSSTCIWIVPNSLKFGAIDDIFKVVIDEE